LLNNDSDSLQERVLHLEKKVHQQDDEIVCLKSALADALRRLTVLETGGPIHCYSFLHAIWLLSLILTSEIPCPSNIIFWSNMLLRIGINSHELVVVKQLLFYA
jgi:hypothetical protein